MRPDFIDRHSRLDSPIHRLPAWLKLVAAMTFVAAALAVPAGRWQWFAAGGAALILIAAVSRVPPLFLLRRLLWLEPFVLGIGLLMLLRPDGGFLFLTFATRSTLCLFTMILLSNTTPFAQILAVLRRVRVPSLLITTLALMYRYLWVLIDESHRMKRARQSRTFTPTRRFVWRSLGAVVAQLFIRASERAERVYAAMCARGWR